MSSVDVFGDFCLTCDAQTNGTNFCSQACRLAELDHFTSSEPTSPSHRSSTASQRNGFYLPPAYDFSMHRVSSATSLSTSSSTSTAQPKTSKLTEQARNSLRDYVGSFDQTRSIKRRVSTQSA